MPTTDRELQAPPTIEDPCATCGHARRVHVGLHRTGTCCEVDCSCKRWKRSRPSPDGARTTRTIVLTAPLHDVLLRALSCAERRRMPDDMLRTDELRRLTQICRSAKLTDLTPTTPEIWKSPASQGSRYYRVTRTDPIRLHIEPWSLQHGRRRHNESAYSGTQIPPGWIRVRTTGEPDTDTELGGSDP